MSITAALIPTGGNGRVESISILILHLSLVSSVGWASLGYAGKLRYCQLLLTIALSSR